MAVGRGSGGLCHVLWQHRGLRWESGSGPGPAGQPTTSPPAWTVGPSGWAQSLAARRRRCLPQRPGGIRWLRQLHEAVRPPLPSPCGPLWGLRRSLSLAFGVGRVLLSLSPLPPNSGGPSSKHSRVLEPWAAWDGGRREAAPLPPVPSPCPRSLDVLSRPCLACSAGPAQPHAPV